MIITLLSCQVFWSRLATYESVLQAPVGDVNLHVSKLFCGPSSLIMQ
jgi:hypothetical protein